MSRVIAEGAGAPRVEGPALRPAPWLVALPAGLLLATAAALMLRRVEPFVNYFYISAWYPTLLLLDTAVAARSGRYYLLSRPRLALSLLAWSAVLWFFFELVNFRVANWYYVFLPPDRPVRWLGTTVSFATVLPAIFLAERWLTARGAYERIRWPTFGVSRRTLWGVLLTGILFAALSLAWPRIFFPMIWGALTLLLEPWNYLRDPARSLLADLSKGRPARLLRFLTGGLAIGFIWELYNIESRSKWVYTVPGFENLKLFEMPLAGFLGFPVFALDCFVVYQSLVLARVAIAEKHVPPESAPRLSPRRTALAAVAAAAFSLAILFGMDRWNTDSLRPLVQDLWVAESADRERLAGTPYEDLFLLAGAEPAEVADVGDVTPGTAYEWIAAARLSTLRGIGTENGRIIWDAGIRSVDDLAAADPGELSARLRAMTQRPRAATPPKVRVWVRAARRATGERWDWATR
ncbi:MAG: helix-hairpin-helix domain-containing protein [Gemmatimonadota bacterium]|nr:MAG: helix-hairpin-helix domain-containing protein [Gemmatimonadota bacterium]